MALVIDHLVIDEADLEQTFSRSGGAGGQNVNKVSSKVLLRFHLARCAALSPEVKARLAAASPSRVTDGGDFLVTSDLTRDQAQNIADAREKLADLIRAALHVPRARKKTRPSKGSQRRRLDSKSKRAATKRLRGRVDD